MIVDRPPAPPLADPGEDAFWANIPGAPEIDENLRFSRIQ